MADQEELPPTQHLVMEVLAARARLGEQEWPFPGSVRPALNALEARGLIGQRSPIVPNGWRAFLTDAGREMALSYPYEPPAVRKLQDLLGSIWLYIPWHFVTKQLTTEQKELFADAVDASGVRLNVGDPDLRAGRVERWWRDDA